MIPTTDMQTRRSKAGPYRLLYEYLEKRYADTVVLTLQQVQDLLGFTLAGSRPH